MFGVASAIERKKWKVGSALMIYSKSDENWHNGTVKSITGTGTREQMLIEFANGHKVKLPRSSKDLNVDYLGGEYSDDNADFDSDVPSTADDSDDDDDADEDEVLSMSSASDSSDKAPSKKKKVTKKKVIQKKTAAKTAKSTTNKNANAKSNMDIKSKSASKPKHLKKSTTKKAENVGTHLPARNQSKNDKLQTSNNIARAKTMTINTAAAKDITRLSGKTPSKIKTRSAAQKRAGANSPRSPAQKRAGANSPRSPRTQTRNCKSKPFYANFDQEEDVLD